MPIVVPFPCEISEIPPRAPCGCFILSGVLTAFLTGCSLCFYQVRQNPQPRANRPQSCVSGCLWDPRGTLEGYYLVGWCPRCCLNHEARNVCIQIPAQLFFSPFANNKVTNFSVPQLKSPTFYNNLWR